MPRLFLLQKNRQSKPVRKGTRMNNGIGKDKEILSQELELSDEQIARNDEIYNAVYQMCQVMTENEVLEWDMFYIGEIAEFAANLMLLRGEKVRFPAVVTEENGEQHIEEYYE